MRFFVLAFFLLHAPALFAERHNYVLTDIASVQEQCQQIDEQIAEKFARIADAVVLGYGCEQNSRKRFDLVIEYARSVPATLVTTYDRHSYVNGIYATGEECRSNIEADQNTFRAATGLEPLIAYCIRDRRDPQLDNGWAMRIDSFGKAQLTPQHLARDFYHGVNGDIAAVQEHLRATLERFGAMHSKVRVMATPDRSIVHAVYYAAHRLPILQFNEGQFADMASCESYRQEWVDIFAQADGAAAIFFCGGTTISRAVYMYAAGVVLQPLATDLASMKFDSIAACDAKRRETERVWRESLDKDVVGSVCAHQRARLDRGSVRMRLFWVE